MLSQLPAGFISGSSWAGCGVWCTSNCQCISHPWTCPVSLQPSEALSTHGAQQQEVSRAACPRQKEPSFFWSSLWNLHFAQFRGNCDCLGRWTRRVWRWLHERSLRCRFSCICRKMMLVSGFCKQHLPGCPCWDLSASTVRVSPLISGAHASSPTACFHSLNAILAPFCPDSLSANF